MESNQGAVEGRMGEKIRGVVRSPKGFAYSVSSCEVHLLDGIPRGKKPLDSSWGRNKRALLVGFLPLLFLLASCSGSGGGGGSDSSLHAELTFTPYADAVFITLNNDTSNLGDVVDLTIRALDENGREVSNVTLRIEDLVRGHNYTIPDGTYLFELIATVRTDTDSFISRKIRIDYRGVRPDASGRIIVGEVSNGGDGSGNGSGGGDGPGIDPGDGAGPGSDPGDSSGNDPDGDRVVNSEDVDDDGDGLIEISTAAELNAMRYALDGSGRKLNATAELNSAGCGNGADITACNGYELVANISLADYGSGSGWQPVGSGVYDPILRCKGEERFSGIFEGNHHKVSDLKINRPNEDCVGFFGFVDKGSEIRNFIIHAETIAGNRIVGVLAGEVNSTLAEVSRIINSHILVDSITGRGQIGGLAGRAHLARIFTSSSVLGSVFTNGDNGHRGGLVGDGIEIWIISSSAVVGGMTGSFNENIGGLVGTGSSGRIVSSYATVGSLGEQNYRAVGGLVGSGSGTRIASSYGVTQSLLYTDTAGGLVGDGRHSRIAFSYTVSNLTSGSGAAGVGPLGGVRTFFAGTVTNTSSYWDSDVNNITEGTGTPQSGMALRMPIDYEGIYAPWDDGFNIVGDSEVEDITIWCDNDWDGEISAAERTDDNRIWDFGTSEQYPAIRCAPESPAEQRRWWFLNDQGEPVLNRTRLDELLP